jgi:NADH-quinone oxidoreductase subunit J
MLAAKWIIFLSMALLSIVSSLLMVTRRNAIHSALWLIVTFFSIAIIYLTLGAQFIAVAQVIVYAGAIVMLIVFVVMLIHLEKEAQESRKFTGAKMVAFFVTIILFLEILAAGISFQTAGKKGIFTPEALASAGNVESVGRILYGQYLFPFEIASILLLIGIVGAVILTKRRKD